MHYFICVFCTSTEDTERRAHALEDMQRRLEEEHALQMSLLLAEQEKQQHCLRLVSKWNCTVVPMNILKIYFPYRI